MPEMEPHETFDGKPAYDIGMAVGDWFPAFEERSEKFHIYDAALFDYINREANERFMERKDFLHSCFRVGRVLVAMDPEDRMAIRTSSGFEKDINFHDDKYYLTKDVPKFVSPTHSFKILSPGISILMEQSNKFGVPIEEAFERTLRIGLDVSESLREEGTWIPIYRKNKKSPTRARFFEVAQEKRIK